jgi:hypothetical protein
MQYFTTAECFMYSTFSSLPKVHVQLPNEGIFIKLPKISEAVLCMHWAFFKSPKLLSICTRIAATSDNFQKDASNIVA